MKHKNVVQFFRAFSFNNCTYLVLELCPNGSLMDMVKRRRGLTEPEVRFYTVQIAGAIKYMHGKGIIHRDLKMGNIFLDSKMNAKIGDFGLAALLVTGRDMHTIRRTTLCGTPNYIAPEILEKGKKGHDHNVDIWSLGIIVFAMLTSKPPFQSSTTDEIYRRARERDYEWPDAEKTNIIISQEAKDLVSTMLTDAEQRPDPDAILEHGFFTSGYMPAESDIQTKLREVPPERVEFYSPMSSSVKTQSLRNLKTMCRECHVGPFCDSQPVHTQIWKEMTAEEKAGLTPAIPLQEGIVYRPFEDWIKEQQQQRLRYAQSIAAGSAAREETAGTVRGAAPTTGLLRQPPQSFAAQQRAQGRPVTQTASTRAPPAIESASQSVRVRSRQEQPRETTRTREVADPSRSVRGIARTAVPGSRTASASSSSTCEQTAQSVPSHSSSTSSHSRSQSGSIRTATLFSPSEQAHRISGTKPDVILERLQRLQGELERALNSRSMAIISSKMTTPPHPHVVVKWVDYTNKFGLGYILNDGSVGCILRDMPTTEGSRTALLPSAGVFIRGAERHILRRQDETYADRNQAVPMTENIKFFENNGESGLAEATLDPEQFRVPVNEDGTAGKMNPGKDIYQHRKRERIILWKKFANYMIAYGRDEAIASMDPDSPAPDQQKKPSPELVTFYQRFGDVGCWVFCDGHLQFNFPDHTKIVLDSTGTWCHFWHLPQDAAERLAQTGTIGAAALDDRATLSYPLQTLLNFSVRSGSSRTASTTRRRPEIDPEIQGIPAANDFRRKVEFIKTIVKEWVTNGGLGNSDMTRDSRLRWTGYRESVGIIAPQKHVWVTIGARGGDSRYTCYVDGKRPWELGEEVDAKK